MMSGTTLIVGGDSLLGRGLQERLLDAGLPYIQTSRRNLCGNALHLDLASEPSNWPTFSRVRQAIFCAGMSNMQDCEKDPDGTRMVNVHHTLALLRRLSMQGVFAVFLSTSLVFDGLCELPHEGSTVSPVNEYARQKAEVEQELRMLSPRPAILRLTKVLSDGNPQLRRWKEALANGHTIHPFEDLRFAPVSIDAAISAILTTAFARKGGVWHFSGKENISYAQSCFLMAERLGLPRNRIRPKPALLSTLPYDQLPRHAGLGMNLTTKKLGLEPQPFSEVLSSVLGV